MAKSWNSYPISQDEALGVGGEEGEEVVSEGGGGEG